MSLQERVLELKKKSEKDEERRKFHEFVLEKLNTGRREELIQKAKDRVLFWQENGSCSMYYIDKWNEILQADISMFASEVVLKRDDNSVALMQNSPFFFLKSEFE